MSSYLTPPEVNKRLSRVEELLRQGQKAEAQAMLNEMRRYTANNPRYWWAVANAANNSQARLDALQRVVELDAQDDDAWAKIRKLDKSVPAPEEVVTWRDRQIQIVGYSVRMSRLVIFAIIAAVVLAVLVAAAIGILGVG